MDVHVPFLAVISVAAFMITKFVCSLISSFIPVFFCHVLVCFCFFLFLIAPLLVHLVSLHFFLANCRLGYAPLQRKRSRKQHGEQFWSIRFLASTEDWRYLDEGKQLCEVPTVSHPCETPSETDESWSPQSMRNPAAPANSETSMQRYPGRTCFVDKQLSASGVARTHWLGIFVSQPPLLRTCLRIRHVACSCTFHGCLKILHAFKYPKAWIFLSQPERHFFS